MVKSDPPPVVDSVGRIPDAALTSILKAMQQLLLTPHRASVGIGLSDQLDRTRLDFTFESLQEIDRYLTAVHEESETIAGLPLLSTVWTLAMYVGEVIRRGAPARRFEWVTVGEPAGATGDTTINYPDLGVIRALQARDGEFCMPSRVVMRIILRGANARTISSFARAAMRLTPPPDTPVSGTHHESS